jgi:hypothetical protein
VQLVGVSVNNNSVAGIITAMKPYNVVGFPGKKISDLSFAFVTPLCTDNCGNFGQVWCHESEINR